RDNFAPGWCSEGRCRIVESEDAIGLPLWEGPSIQPAKPSPRRLRGDRLYAANTRTSNVQRPTSNFQRVTSYRVSQELLAVEWLLGLSICWSSISRNGPTFRLDRRLWRKAKSTQRSFKV